MPRTNSSPPLLTEQDKRYYDQHPNALWVWKAKPGACVDCTARDGRKYRYEDIPERPHPHCKCKVEPVGGGRNAPQSTADVTRAFEVDTSFDEDSDEATRERALADSWERAQRDLAESWRGVSTLEGMAEEQAGWPPFLQYAPMTVQTQSIDHAGARTTSDQGAAAAEGVIHVQVDRIIESPNSTIGIVSVDGVHQGFTLEHPWKDNTQFVSRIPPGEYSSFITETNKFQYPHIRLQDVPGREAVLFHRGNFPRDTHGCILVGGTRGEDFVGDSKATFQAMMREVKEKVKDFNEVGVKSKIKCRFNDPDPLDR